MMLIAFYFALYFVNYSIVTNASSNPGTWQLYLLLPGLISVLIYLMTVRSTALLKAVTRLDADVMENTLEDVILLYTIYIHFVIIVVIYRLKLRKC